MLKIASCQDLESEVKRRWLRCKSFHESEEGQSRKTKWSHCSSFGLQFLTMSNTGAILMYEDCRD